MGVIILNGNNFYITAKVPDEMPQKCRFSLKYLVVFAIKKTRCDIYASSFSEARSLRISRRQGCRSYKDISEYCRIYQRN